MLHPPPACHLPRDLTLTHGSCWLGRIAEITAQKEKVPSPWTPWPHITVVELNDAIALIEELRKGQLS